MIESIWAGKLKREDKLETSISWTIVYVEIGSIGCEIQIHLFLGLLE